MKVFAIYGVSSRGFTKVLGREYMEVGSFEEAVKTCLTKMEYDNVCDEDLEEWLEKERAGIYLYSNDPGDFVLVGEDVEEVMEVYEEYV